MERQIIVNYHYVENPSPRFSGIFPCSVEDFNRQINFLSQNYRIVSPSEVFEAAKAGDPEMLAAITLDDGLKDQYQNTLPILKKYKAVAAFFPITATLDGHLPTAHKIHVLLSRVSAAETCDTFNKFIKEFYPDLESAYRIPKDRRLTDKRMHEDICSANFKETMIFLPEDIKGQFLRYGFKNLGLNEKNISKELFMSVEEIADIQNQGMAVGGHSHNHYAMNVVSEETLRKDIQLNKETLTDILKTAPTMFSYPHGRYSDTALKILKEAGYLYAFTIERRGVAAGDNQLLIPRHDTADLKTMPGFPGL